MWKIARRGQRSASRAEVLPSPNIWYHPDTYELENRAQDVDGDLWRVLEQECDWAGGDVLDVGCGDGFHLPRFATTAKSVIGVEPHEPLVRRAERRVAELPAVRVLPGSAQAIPVPDASADLVHARTAYFFGPGCEPGLREVDRVLRPGGALAIVDLDVSSEPYGRWMRADLPDYDPAAVDSFFAAQGFRCRRVTARWWFPDAESVAAVLRIEFSPPVADRAIADVLRDNGSHGRHSGTAGFTVPVGYRVLVREKPAGLVLPGHSSSSSSSSVSISPSTA
ncbi:class I SAM-dependent methyltransferase [Amycolatopsis thermophila]|uniref:SAM-dependent methyltransferase n=1 Tax=Amycolatopsis thermophila TaxID=206084 RepID=A0ABU0EN19_9PSEU|nr:class I SAM-dependent methyltransferase [Amycolatopsis thermophila]MDQ0376696.1 SAM-dependent methyltransferase [Amycolatopsis thermophila]